MIGNGSRQSVLTFDGGADGRARVSYRRRAFRATWMIFRHVSLGEGVLTDAYAERARAPTDHSSRDHIYLAKMEELVGH